MARTKLTPEARATVFDVLGAVAIALGAGAITENYFGIVVGGGAFLLVLGGLRAAVTVWNAK